MKKFLKRTLVVIGLLIASFSIFAVVSGKTYLFKAVYRNFANIDDYQIFDNDTVKNGQPIQWQLASNYNKITYTDSLNQIMEHLSTVGLLMIKDNAICFERYWDGYSDSSLSGSFSMAKSITSLLIGAAIKDGKIGSIKDPVGKYIPEFSSGNKANVTIENVLTMSSGSDFSESYINPLSVTSELYYGFDVYKIATGVNIVDVPGTIHRYKSGDTQLLGLIIEKATGKTLSAYASEKLWMPLGAEHAALWSTDTKNGHAKAYCCYNSNVRDFARIGKLMLDTGKINGVAVIDSVYWANSIKPCGILTAKGEKCDYYGYQWWIDPDNKEVFYARGILGQYIICIPSKKIIIVRLGKKTDPKRIRTVPAEVRALITWGYES
ncbi:MAG: serine hydrolase domain-containing protein [Chitinophagaceae bacterium]